MTSFFSQNNEPPAPSLQIPAISLMTPVPGPPPTPTGTHWEEDLGLEEIIRALVTDRRHRNFTRAVLVALTTDLEVIRWRQAVLADFVNNPALLTTVEDILPKLSNLGHTQPMLGRRSRSILVETSDRLSELDLYCELVQDLHNALATAVIESEALQTLRGHLADLLAKPDFQQLRDELPALREPLQNIGSLTVAINLDLNLQPKSAVLVSINQRSVGPPPSLLDKLLGTQSEAVEAGIAPVHRFQEDRQMRRYDEFFQDVDKLMQQTAKPIALALTRYIRTSSQPLVALEPELAFFIAAAGMVQRLRVRGLPVCQPETAPMPERVTRIEGLVNMHLALQEGLEPVPSDVHFDDKGRVAVLTGPNSGGKTTYLRAAGLAQVMFQAGLFIPAASARMSPVDAILTHFPRLETRQQGRLAEEANRLRQIFTQASDHSLILLNETFSSTAFGEALYLAQDILSGLCVIGVRAIFATHLVELVETFPLIQQGVPTRSGLYSLVAGIRLEDDGTAVPTFDISRRAPLGRSYAQEIARRHGISLDQILEAHRQRTNGSQET